jgi:hypothetical protein
MGALGINVTRDGSCAPAAVAGLGAKWVRAVAMADVDLTEWIRQLASVNVHTLLVVARESVGDRTFAQTARLFGERYGSIVSAWQLGNEPDHESPSSWTLPGPRLSELAREFRAVLPGGARIITGGLVSGHPGYLDSVDLGLFDAIAIHPYGRRPTRDWPNPTWGTGYVGDLLELYAPIRKPIWITEVGISSDEVGEQLQADYVERIGCCLAERTDVAVTFHFCMHAYQGFGVVRPNGAEKPACAAFRRACSHAAALPRREQPIMPEPITLDPPRREFAVGPGVRALMKQHGDEPATDEIFHPRTDKAAKPTVDGQHQFSETFGTSGARYVYLFATNQTYRFSPTPGSAAPRGLQQSRPTESRPTGPPPASSRASSRRRAKK